VEAGQQVASHLSPTLSAATGKVAAFTRRCAQLNKATHRRDCGVTTTGVALSPLATFLQNNEILLQWKDGLGIVLIYGSSTSGLSKVVIDTVYSLPSLA